MSSGPGESAPLSALYRDHRDLTPFRTPVIRTPVRGLADGVGGVVSGVLAGRIRGALPVEGGAPRLGKVGGRAPAKAAKAVHAAIFGSSDPDRLIALAHTYPGWAGLCYLMAGLQSYAQGGHLRASELLQRGLLTRNDDDANRYAFTYLARVITRVSVAERVEVPVLFSEEAVFLALVPFAARDRPGGGRPRGPDRAAAVVTHGPGALLAGRFAGTGCGRGGGYGRTAQRG